MANSVQGTDLNEVMCLLCGACPKIINTDGNAKDSIQITPNLKFDFNDKSDIPSLEEFQTQLILHLFKSSFWQNEPPFTVNMLKLPLIIAPRLLRKQVNSDVLKESLLDKSIQHSSVTMREFTKMVDSAGKSLNRAEIIACRETVKISFRGMGDPGLFTKMFLK